MAERRQLSFRWPVEDVSVVRAVHRQARRQYRESDRSRNLTMSAFTQIAYLTARQRTGTWHPAVLVAPHGSVQRGVELLNLSWDSWAADFLEDDWELLTDRSQEAYDIQRRSSRVPARRPRLHKAALARLGIMNGLTDWRAWLDQVPNDPRRGSHS